jgi:hypothetical protein
MLDWLAAHSNSIGQLVEYAAGMVILLIIIGIIPFWKIFRKAGFSPWLTLLMWVPLVNYIILYVVAFSRWDVSRAGSADRKA